MKIHYIAYQHKYNREHGSPVCDLGACVVLGKDGTFKRRWVTCGNCKRTKAFKGKKE